MRTQYRHDRWSYTKVSDTLSLECQHENRDPSGRRGSSTRIGQVGAHRSPSGAAVEARGLTKRFGTNRAVDGIDLTVTEGEIFGVLGPNGAGKTTMLNMLATLLPIDGGEATIFGYDVGTKVTRYGS